MSTDLLIASLALIGVGFFFMKVSKHSMILMLAGGIMLMSGIVMAIEYMLVQ